MQPQIAAQNTVLDLILQSGLVVQMVLLLLIFASILCWAIIISKHRAIRLAKKNNGKFSELFWEGKTLDDISEKLEKFPYSPVASVFKAGYRELRKLNSTEKKGGSAEIENIQRALNKTTQTEIALLERHVGWLATTASAAPFIGLFGTVWGIMNSFFQIGATGSANLATVAPGISEALVATAIGLAAAIPAVVGYNYLVQQIRGIGIDMDSFSQDFLNLVQRSRMGSSQS